MTNLTRWAAIAMSCVLVVLAIGFAVQTFARDHGPVVHIADATGAGRDNLTRVVVLSPKAAETEDATHAALLITSESYSGSLAFAGRTKTVRQIRMGSEPNPWECAWLVWHYTDDEHFYYLAVKPTGWELGKRDPAYPGGQRFLASGEDGFAIGAWHSFAIVQDQAHIVVRLNGVEVGSFTDTERPYLKGRLGLYSEDAEVLMDNITAPFADDFESYDLLSHTTDGIVLGRWVSPFLGHGFVAIADRSR